MLPSVACGHARPAGCSRGCARGMPLGVRQPVLAGSVSTLANNYAICLNAMNCATAVCADETAGRAELELKLWETSASRAAGTRLVLRCPEP